MAYSDKRNKQIEELLRAAGQVRETYYRFDAGKESASCEECRSYDGEMFSSKDNPLPKPPLHPHCKCMLRPIVGPMPKTFKGLENPRFQEHDALIAAVVADFNSHKVEYAGCTSKQAQGISDLSPELFKSFLIQESGSIPAAWRKDPGQVNNPGDWGEYKSDLGLKKPVIRNQGDLRANMIATLKFLARKGFISSGKPSYNRKAGYFEGWRVALERYNPKCHGIITMAEVPAAVRCRKPAATSVAFSRLPSTPFSHCPM